MFSFALNSKNKIKYSKNKIKINKNREGKNMKTFIQKINVNAHARAAGGGQAIFDVILAIAQSQLAEWKTKLNEKCYSDLEKKCRIAWFEADPSKPYDLFRGNRMTEFVCNWKS